jgi:5-methylcytosine-specific restriction endonuclease McrA
MTYSDYIKSNKWFNLRSARISIDNHKCQKCGFEEELNVHHKTYKNLFNENMEDLITLCKRCHCDEHERIRKEKFPIPNEREILRATKVTEEEYNEKIKNIYAW